MRLPPLKTTSKSSPSSDQLYLPLSSNGKSKRKERNQSEKEETFLVRWITYGARPRSMSCQENSVSLRDVDRFLCCMQSQRRIAGRPIKNDNPYPPPRKQCTKRPPLRHLSSSNESDLLTDYFSSPSFFYCRDYSYYYHYC